MKENAKLFLVIMISVVMSSTISITATTLLQANQVSYKTSNSDTTDVNSALDRLFDAADINGRLGNTDISNIGDGTVTGAVSDFNSNLSDLQSKITVVEVTSPSSAGTEVFIDYPEGFNPTNCVILSINVKVDNKYWRNEINGTYSIISSTLKEKIAVASGQSASSAYLSKPVRVTLLKIS